MDQSSPISDPLARLAQARGRPQLGLVDTRFTLVHPGEQIPGDWRAPLEALLGWLGLPADIVPAGGSGIGGQPDLARAPLFAPWHGWSPTAFQHGGLAGLPQAQFVASYLLDHPRGAAPGVGAIDLMLMSPLPAQCAASEQGGVPIPEAGAMRAMLRLARQQRRGRIAIILGARQRGAVAAGLQDTRGALAAEGAVLDLITLEEALPLLAGARPCWDAVIAMPELRSTLFTLLGHARGLSRAWPMLWFGDTCAQPLRLVTSEAPGDGLNHLPLDATTLVQTLALTLNAAGAQRAAARLHEGWARLRDSGITTAGQGKGGTPYCNEVDDSAFVEMLCRDGAVSKRPQQPWRALGNDKKALHGSQNPPLRVIA